MDKPTIAPINSRGVRAMRIFKRVTIGMVLAGVAAPALASTIDRQGLTHCKSELKRVYGEDSRTKAQISKTGV